MAINETISRAVGAATSALGQPIRYLTDGGEFVITAVVRRANDGQTFAVVTLLSELYRRPE